MEQAIVKAKPQLYQMILEKHSKIELIYQFSGLTLSGIIDERYPSITALERTHGEEKTAMVIAVILSDLSTSFGGDLNKDEILEIVAELRSGDTRNLSLESLYLVCREIKVKHEFKLKVSVVLKAMQKHFEDYSNELANRNYQAHLQTKYSHQRSSSVTQKTDEAFSAFYADYLKKTLKK